MRTLFPAIAVLLLASPLSARESLGIFDEWGSFSDPDVPRCYAIASAERPAGADYAPFASVGTWPRSGVRGQVHVRLSRETSATSTISLRVGNKRFQLTGGGGDAWSKDAKMDSAIVAAMRSGGTMHVSARDVSGRRFTDSYSLAGAATAMDAATVGCARYK